ncbi:YhcH/YjgK/YiaL family protein [Ornithobacterium rhinotracheale]|uniref:YhcH/YjgK/YiaL family protein n=1 Tax=Ornithobacterium rhinotracheale TaxID=28251 RepID=UPI001FF66558|nr:YhcH/YjgK/YiaL family protein [Ornithobacterium rhinotracheale]MCK0204427.1 YhcH/YjgK/YiaL family protein [Ornithobacterium rhinotracheale]
MILSNLKNSSRYENLHPAFKKAFDYIKSHDLLNAELGKIYLDDDNLFIANSNSTLKKKEEQVLEYHKKYIDIQIVLEGKEVIGWKDLDECTDEKQAYLEEKDCGLYNDAATSYFELQPNDFVIFYPEDAHAPVIGEGTVRKLVVKVKI